MTLKLNYPDKKPDNLCLAPFTMTRPDVRGWNSPCPFGAGDWPHAHLNASEQWDAKELNNLRQKHLNNEQASECKRCFTEEEINLSNKINIPEIIDTKYITFQRWWCDTTDYTKWKLLDF